MSVGDVLSKAGANTLEQIFGYGIGGAVTPVVEWIARPITYKVNSENPNVVLDPQTLVVAQIRLAGTGFDGTNEAAASGLNPDRYKTLLASQRTPPDASALIELMRRNKLSEDQFSIALERTGLDPEFIDQFLALSEVLLSAEDLAMARQQGFISEDEARRRSALVGVPADDADLMFKLAGLPPGPEQMIELWRRGMTTEDRVRQSLVEGHIKLDYVDDVLKLKTVPLSASVAANALIRQRVSKDKAVAIAEQNGLTEEDFLLWSDMIGRPIADGQALQLARRGEFTYQQFEESVARSDVRTEYAPELWKLRTVLPNLFQLRALVTQGAITDQRAVEIASDLGYAPDIAHGIVQAAKNPKKQRTKDLAATQIDSLYESGLESRKWATDALVGLGYDPDEAEWHLELLDARRLLAALQSNLNLIHREYVNHKIDEHTATMDLDQIGVAPDVRNLLLETWTNERKANVARLTNAQIGSALKYAGMPRGDAISRWMQNGYSEDDANWLADIALKVPHNAVTPTP